MSSEKPYPTANEASLTNSPSTRHSTSSHSDSFSIHTIAIDAERQGPRENELEKVVSYASGAEGYPAVTRKNTGAALSTVTTSDPAYEIDWEDDDAGNPKNWPLWYKGLIIFAMSYGTSSVVLYSTSYTSGIPGLEKEFGISDTEGILGVTTYLLGECAVED